MTTPWALLTIGQEVELEYKAEMHTNNNISVLLAVHARVGKSNVFSSDRYRDLYTCRRQRRELKPKPDRRQHRASQRNRTPFGCALYLNYILRLSTTSRIGLCTTSIHFLSGLQVLQVAILATL